MEQVVLQAHMTYPRTGAQPDNENRRISGVQMAKTEQRPLG